MNWNDYEAVWKRQELPVGQDANMEILRRDFQDKHRKLAATLLVRDFSEAGAGLVVAGFYAWYWWKIGRTAWPMVGAIVLISGVAVFFIRERLRAVRSRLTTDATLRAKVESDLAELRKQHRMVRNLWWWYLLPCSGAIAIHLVVIVRQTASWDPLREPLILAGFGGFFAAVMWFVWFINQRAVQKRIEPRIEELEALHRELMS